MKNKKGFTLVELLAIIVILAVIALVAVPIILNVIESAKKGAIKDSAHGIIESANVYVASNLKDGLKNNIKFTCSNNKCVSSKGEEITFKGKVENGTLIINTKSNVVVCVDDGEYYALKLENDKNVTNGEGTCGEYEEEQGEFVISSDFDTLLEENKEIKKELEVYKKFYGDELSIEFPYNGTYQTFIVPTSGTYRIELWGGGTKVGGAYVAGTVHIEKDVTLYVYVGQSGVNTNGGFNGGSAGYSSGYGGAGATDVRIFEGTPTTSDLVWNSSKGLANRIIVAGGAGGGDASYAGEGGGLTGGNGIANGYAAQTAYGGTQVAGGSITNFSSSYRVGTAGSFGTGGIGGGAANYGSYGGGGGWYGGAGGSRLNNGSWPGAGGSSYIFGHEGCVGVSSAGVKNANAYSKIEDSYSHTGYIFTDTVMIDGKGFAWTTSKAATASGMPKHDGTTDKMNGNITDGYAKITLLSID